MDFVFFPLGLSNFWVGAWFPLDEGQLIGHPVVFSLDTLDKSNNL